MFQGLINRLYWLLLLAHALEVAFALGLCASLGLTLATRVKWAASVAVNGFFSLRLILSESKKTRGKQS